MKAVKFQNDNKGISLVEVIVSMVILLIITVPLLSYFISSASYNSKTKSKQTAITLAQSIMDKTKDRKIEAIAKGFHATTAAELLSDFTLVDPSKINNPVDSTNPQEMVGEMNADGSLVAKKTAGSFTGGKFTTTNSTDGCLYYKISNIKDGKNSYDAVITIDTNSNTGDSYFSVNTSNLYHINAISSPTNLVAVETTQNTLAVYEMKSLNLSYCDLLNAAHAGDAAWTMKVPVNETTIENSLTRDIYITMDYDTDETAKVKVYYRYYCNSVEGCPNSSGTAKELEPPLYSETVKLADIKNVYLFFRKLTNSFGDTVNVILDIDPLVQSKMTQKFHLYLLGQAADMSADTAPPFDFAIQQVNASYNKVDHIYTNSTAATLDGVGITTCNYITSSAILRMMNVKVDIYKAGELNNSKFLYASLTSTKVE